MMNIWLGDPEAYFFGRKSLDPATQILGMRRMEHADLYSMEHLIRPETYEIFGRDMDIGRIYEASCLAVVQCNEERDIVSGICLCNYPNVPSVTPDDWLTWLYTLYKVECVTERNTMFVHFLAWDKRYTRHFFENLLTGLFDVASYLQHVLLVVPPGIIIADVFERQMIRVPARCAVYRPSMQSIYMTERHLRDPRLRIRRVVEEDNDDVIPIIGAETSVLTEFYGEYYVSEMVRHPDNSRRLIVSEDDEGLATGVMFLNSTIDVESLNENFELDPYNGLKKPREHDRFPLGCMEPASETFFPIFTGKPRAATPEREPVKITLDESMEGFEDMAEPSDSGVTIDDQSIKQIVSADDLAEPSQTLLSELPSMSNYFDTYYKSKMMTSAFLDSMFDIPRKTGVPTVESSESLSMGHIKLPVQPVYYGEPNAFVLEIFATQNRIRHRWSKNFVEAAFECFPDLDYCAILLPFSHPFLPILEHFVRVPLRCNKDYPMTLYVTHRAALLGHIQLRPGKESDRDEIQELLQRIPKMEQILVDFDEAVKRDRSDLYCYVLQWNETIVGLVILCAEKEATYIRRRYRVEDYIAVKNIRLDAYGRILHFILMPIFSIHLHYFFCEIMRFSGLIVLYYRLDEIALSALTRTQPLTICLNSMVPVNPRLRIEYKYRGFVETDEPGKETEPFSLFMTTPRLAMMPNIVIDSKIVVVGASDCGIAFIESLALGENFIRFGNLTLISSHGLPFESDINPVAARMIPFRGRYCREYRRLVAARARINIVYGTVVSIQRKEKYVTVMNQGNVDYDYLILTCGLQYQRPQFKEESKRTGEDEEVPWNCFTVNDDFEAAQCVEKLQSLTNDFTDEKRIIFYGHTLDCYCAVQSLLELGIKGSWITLIQPPLPQCDTHETIFFDDCEVCVEVMNSLMRNDIEILVGWQLIDWGLKDSSTDSGMIESIVMRSKGKTRTMVCDALLCFHAKTIDMKIFLAICSSGLVFDGHLVIDPDFRTNDPCILAGGTITMYCRKFYADAWHHAHYNRIEVGERMAKVLRKFVDNQHAGVEEAFEPFKGKTYMDIHVFRSPIIVACTLPGYYNYLHVRKPGKTIQRQITIRYDIYGQVLITGSCTSEIGYFRIRLNRLDSVETVTCFTKKYFEMRHMVLLYGKHESLLNELKTRFEESLIVDFYAYFREPWAMAIFYDRFECLRVENRATLLSKTAIPGHSLISDCIRALVNAKWNTLTENDRRVIQSRFVGSVYQQEIEESLLEFLEFCEEDVPVYCTPGKLRDLCEDNEYSPLYTDV